MNPKRASNATGAMGGACAWATGWKLVSLREVRCDDEVANLRFVRLLQRGKVWWTLVGAMVRIDGEMGGGRAPNGSVYAAEP